MIGLLLFSFFMSLFDNEKRQNKMIRRNVNVDYAIMIQGTCIHENCNCCDFEDTSFILSQNEF